MLVQSSIVNKVSIRGQLVGDGYLVAILLMVRDKGSKIDNNARSTINHP